MNWEQRIERALSLPAGTPVDCEGARGWDVTTYPWKGDFATVKGAAVLTDKPRHVGDIGAEWVFVLTTNPNRSPAERIIGIRGSDVYLPGEL